jgi:hypothetical protein
VTITFAEALPQRTGDRNALRLSLANCELRNILLHPSSDKKIPHSLFGSRSGAPAYFVNLKMMIGKVLGHNQNHQPGVEG